MSATCKAMDPTDQVPELPGGPAIAGHHVNTTLHNPHHHLDDSNSVPPSPSSPNSPGDSPSNATAPAPPHDQRRPSSASSHVPFDHFDREGIQELSRSLTNQSNVLAHTAERANAQTNQLAPPVPSSSSQATTVEDPFDLENYLRNIVRK